MTVADARPRAPDRRDWGQTLGLPPMRQRPPWLGPDLQTLRNTIMRDAASLARWPATTLTIPTRDGTGDALLAYWHAPTAGTARRPLVVLVHGLTGCSESPSVLTSAAAWLSAGWPVMRLNLRGAGAGRSRASYTYTAHLSGDIAAVLDHLGATPPLGGVVLMGYSLGANLILKWAGEGGPERAPVPVQGIVAVSPPLDLAAAARRFDSCRNRPYHGYILKRLRAGAAAAPGARPATVASARAAGSLIDFDHRVTAPLNGFRDAWDYYSHARADAVLGDIKVPSLVVHARDDPWVGAEPAASFPWASNPWLAPLITRRGGHCGFHDRGAPPPWHDRAARAFVTQLADGDGRG